MKVESVAVESRWSDSGRGEREREREGKCGRQERNLKSHCSGGAERAEESHLRRTLRDMDVSSAVEKVGQETSTLTHTKRTSTFIAGGQRSDAQIVCVCKKSCFYLCV